jgi:hypothetical protein
MSPRSGFDRITYTVRRGGKVLTRIARKIMGGCGQKLRTATIFPIESMR